MKKIFFLLLPFVLIITTCEKKDEGPNPNDIVNIPDIEFLYALINEGVDTNGDGLISYAEAEAVDTLSCGGYYIENCGWGGTPCTFPRYGDIISLVGIEAFTNLKSLDCSMNDLTSLDMSNNKAIIYLECRENQLTSLDVSGCTELKYLTCHLNKLTSLDVSNNAELRDLSIGCEDSHYLAGGGQEGQFTTLDVSNNNLIEVLGLDYMPSLHKVCVWEMPFPPEGVEINTTGSPNVYFTTDCSK